MTTGKVPAWMYFVKFEGFSEEDAKTLADEANKENKASGLFGDE